MKQVMFIDTDPDTGEVSQKFVVGIWEEDVAYHNLQICQENDGDNPNREYSVSVKPIICVYCEELIKGWFRDSPVYCCSKCLPKELHILEHVKSGFNFASDVSHNYLMSTSDGYRNFITNLEITKELVKANSSQI